MLGVCELGLGVCDQVMLCKCGCVSVKLCKSYDVLCNSLLSI